MKFILLATAFTITAYAAPTDEWNLYKAKYNKVYTSETENTRRLEQYLKSKEMVEEHNRKYDRGETTYTMGINQFSDWFPEEFNKLYSPIPKKFVPSGKPFEFPPDVNIPDNVNWVSKGAVTAVKDQRRCNAGYGFTAAAIMEGLMFVKNNTITDLSAQELVDCSGEYGCLGGNMEGTVRYMVEYGLQSNESYPYKGKTQVCRVINTPPAAYATDYRTLTGEEHLRKAVAKVGPVGVSFKADTSFFQYKSGIYNGPCAMQHNHDLLAVGYGIDEKTKQDYWFLKNSWGTDWGEKGYLRIVRHRNKCGLATLGIFLIYH